MRRFPWLLLAILLAALSARLAWSLHLSTGAAAIDALPDQREYISLGDNLLHKHRLEFYDPRFHETVRAFRTPGYPAFVALAGGGVRLVRFGQSLLDTLTALAVFLLARELRQSDAAAMAAAGIVAVNPLLIAFTGLILSETLFAAMLAWGIYLLARGLARGRWWTWLAGGVVLALSTLVRPAAAPLAVVLGVASVVLLDRQNLRGTSAYPWEAIGTVYNPPPTRRSRWGVALRAGAVMGILTGLTLLPWAWRNRDVVGRWVWTTTNAGATAYDGFNPRADGASDQWFIAEMPQLQLMGEVERSRYLSRRARDYAIEHSARSAWLAVLKAGRTWSPVPLSREYGDWKRSLMLLAYALPLDVLVIAGLFGPVGRTIRPGAKGFLVAPALYFTVVHAMSVGSLRYRVPVEPMLAVIAGAALVEWVRRRRGQPIAG